MVPAKCTQNLEPFSFLMCLVCTLSESLGVHDEKCSFISLDMCTLGFVGDSRREGEHASVVTSLS